MQQVFLVGDEPIPGYKLIEELPGGSAFYKMWKVRSPTGEYKLWKVIDMVVGNAAVETRTLSLLVQLRHPYLNTLTNFWQIDDGKTLIVESDVPSMSLRQRLEQCQRQGQTGIPVDDLQTFFEQAAEGLDFLNSPRHQFQGQQVAIYHRSLRPESLLLFTGGPQPVCKVSDFGLSKPVTEANAAHTQSLTHYDYDPPEFFEGQTAPTSDQYSLAINYYELRTGALPFTGTVLEQLQARMMNSPNLQQLNEPERGVIHKALSYKPDERFENCKAFIKELKSSLARGVAQPTGDRAWNLQGTATAPPDSRSGTASRPRPDAAPLGTAPAAPRRPPSTPPATRPAARGLGESATPAAVAQQASPGSERGDVGDGRSTAEAVADVAVGRGAAAPPKKSVDPSQLDKFRKQLTDSPKASVEEGDSRIPMVWVLLILILFAGILGGAWYFLMGRG